MMLIKEKTGATNISASPVMIGRKKQLDLITI